MIPLYLAPSIDLTRFGRTDLFPPPPDFSKVKRICIGTKTRTIGDALILSTLPGKLKLRFPELEIHTFPRAFNRVVFHGNPAISGVDWLPDRLYGDDASQGDGHLIQLKENYFDVSVQKDPKPEIHLTPREICWGREYLKQHSHLKVAKTATLPLCLVHPWGHTWKKVVSTGTWARLIQRWQGRIRFWQVGIEGQEKIPGCEHWFLPSRAFRHARRLFSVMARADFFLGVNSGPMHVARAFGLPSLIFTEEGDIAQIFEVREKGPYFLHRNFSHAFLYEANTHLDVPSVSEDGLLEGADAFFKARS